MPYARTTEQLAALRVAGILPAVRWPSGPKRPPTTRAGRQQHREGKAVESEASILSVALAQPHRAAAPAKHLDGGKWVETDKRDPRIGYALGEARLRGYIDADELTALNRYVVIYLRYGFHINGKLPKFPCMEITGADNGVSCTAEMSQDGIDDLKRAFGDMQAALAGTFLWHECARAIHNVGVMNCQVSSEVEALLLKVAGSALHRLWT